MGRDRRFNSIKVFENMSIKKIIFQEYELEHLKEVVEEEKKTWKTIVWTNGCFDIMHPGHMKTFEVAKKMVEDETRRLSEDNNIVVVWLNGDKNPYWKMKPWRPINDEEFRSKMLASLKNVDYVYIFNDKNPLRPVDKLKPDYVLKWGDYYLWKWIVNSEKWIIKNEKLKYLLNNVENFVKEKNWILDITEIYKYILGNNLEKITCKVSWYMPEWFVNVKNGWKVVLVPVEWNYSTSSIVEKIRPKEIFDLVMFWKKYKNKFKDLKDFLVWYHKKLEINYYFNKYTKVKFKQFDIYMINLWQNIWWEINKIRPCLVIWKTNKFLNSNTILIIPFTDLYNKKGVEKKISKEDLIIKSSNINWLKKDSILKIRKIKEVSKKRVLYKLWKLENNYRNILLDWIKNII